jgi:hypothetical protein
MEDALHDMAYSSKKSASEMSSDTLKSILKNKIPKNILPLNLRQEGSSEVETGFEAKGNEIRRKSDKVIVQNWKDLVIDMFYCAGTQQFGIDENNPARRSSAKMYMEEPHAIVEWNFPCMNYKNDE